MIDETTMVRALSEFARTAFDQAEVTDLLHRLAEAAGELFDATGTGVSLAYGDQVRFVTSPSEAIVALEQAQEQAQSGPCVEATRTGLPVVVRDIPGQAAQWPAYVAAAAEAGIVCVAGIPLRTHHQALGALNIYDAVARPWSEADITVALLLADITAGHLLTTAELERQRRTTEQLQAALDSRVIIEQAKGVLAASRSISVDDAFECMRRHARNRQASLRTVADAVVHLGLRPEPCQGGGPVGGGGG